MSDPENMENQGFKINDQRRFAPDGTPLSEEKSPKEEEKIKSEASQEAWGEELPANLSTLILSLAAGAQSALGVAPNPLTGKIEKDLLQAKYHVDLLGILVEKTKGNLTSEEEKLLQTILYDLRIKYLEAKKI